MGIDKLSGRSFNLRARTRLDRLREREYLWNPRASLIGAVLMAVFRLPMSCIQCWEGYRVRTRVIQTAQQYILSKILYLNCDHS